MVLRWVPQLGVWRSVCLCMILLIFLLGLFWDAIPGSIYFDSNGFPHGTGYARYYYKNGALQIEDWYFRGYLEEQRWFRPDGTFIVQSNHERGKPSYWYVLREDGTIRRRYPMINGEATGPPVFYKPNGTESPVDLP